MDTKDIEYEEFIKKAKYWADKIGAKKIADRYPCAPTHIYQVINGDKNAGRVVQLKFAKACGFNTIAAFIGDGYEDDKPTSQLEEKIQDLEEKNELLKDIIEAQKQLKAKAIEEKETARQCYKKAEEIISHLITMADILEGWVRKFNLPCELPWITNNKLKESIDAAHEIIKTGTGD